MYSNRHLFTVRFNKYATYDVVRICEFVQFLLTLTMNIKKLKIKNAPETKKETFYILKWGHWLNILYVYSDDDLLKSSIKSHVY